MLAWIVVSLTFALWFVLKAVDAPVGPLHRTRELFLILLAQGGIGYVQYFTELPEVLVGAHMLGSCMMWIAVMRVLLSLRERPELTLDVPAQAEASSPPPGRSRRCSGVSRGRPVPASPYTRRALPAPISSATRSASAATRRPRRPSRRAPAHRLAEQPGAHHMQLGQPVRAAGEQQLAERRQFQDLREHRRRPGPGAHQRRAQVGVDVREDAASWAACRWYG